MEVLAILFVGWLMLGALRRRPTLTPTITIKIVERGDDRDPPPARGPRPEPEVEECNRQASKRERVVRAGGLEMIDRKEFKRDAQEQWADVKQRGWDAPGDDQWTFARCLRLAWDRAKIRGTPAASNTMTFFKRGDVLATPEWALTSWRQIVDMLVEDGELSPERRAVCLKALQGRAINLSEVVYNGAEPKIGRVNRG